MEQWKTIRGPIMNKVTVRIIGQDYTLKGDEEVDYLKKVGSEVNDLVESIKSRNGTIDTASAAILAAVNAMDQSFKSKEKLNQLKETKGSVYQEVEVQKEHASELQDTLKQMEKDFKVAKEELEILQMEKEDLMHHREKEIKRLEIELRLTQDSAKEYRDENQSLSKLNKEIRFDLQSYKYKVLELQKKLFDLELSKSSEGKERKDKNPILKEKKS